MKTKFVRFFIKLFEIILGILYFFLKMLPIKENKIVFCSRQSNILPLDFKLIQRELLRRNPNLEIINICRRIGEGFTDYVKFAKALINSMYHLATSKVCVIDSYWPAVSILNHKDTLTVIQLWHAIGKIKKSGYQSVGMKSGRKKEYAKLLHMHENYDYIIAGSKAWNKYYCEAFNTSEDKLLNCGLPRIDYLINTERENRKRFFSENPDLKDKKIILYAPTFRRNMKSSGDKIINAFNSDKYTLIIKNHPGHKMQHNKCKGNEYSFDNWQTIDLLSVCDILITDYSAIALEAIVLNKKTYFWTYDYDSYLSNNGLNYNLKREVGNNVYCSLNDLINKIDKDEYDFCQAKEFRDKYLPSELGISTDTVCNLILNHISI